MLKFNLDHRFIGSGENRIMDEKIINIEKDEEQISDNGVDLTLIRWMLSLTPIERLQTLQNNVRSILRLRDGKQRT